MPALSEIEGARVVGSGGTPLGEVARVLFHPTEPRAIALMIDRARVLGIVALPAAFVRWEDARLGEGEVVLGSRRLPGRRRVEEALGLDADSTVIWRGMPVKAAGDVRIGTIGDASLDSDGRVLALSVSTGAVGDLAHGRVHVPGEAVRGFDGTSVVIEASAEDLEAAGGLARSAAKGAASVKAAAGEGAKAAGNAIVGASYATGRALAKAAKSKPAKRARGAFKGLADAYREGRDGK